MAAESGDAMMPRHPAPGCTAICMYEYICSVASQTREEFN